MGFAAPIQELSHIVMDTRETGRHPGTAPKAHPSQDWQSWQVEEDGAHTRNFKTLTREEAQALREKDPPLSPWRVVGVQVVVGVLVALLAAAITGSRTVGWSAFYGAATVVLPGALMARGMTSRLTSLSPGSSAVSFMLWQAVKIVLSLAMLALAYRIVQPLNWPALLAGLVVCIKVYWVALLWRGRR